MSLVLTSGWGCDRHRLASTLGPPASDLASHGGGRHSLTWFTPVRPASH